MPVLIKIIDAFTKAPFRGNPAAVCLLVGPAEDQWMQQVAAEMNLSETAFLLPTPGGFGLRWFTPTTEVDLCGHATLASAHSIWEDGLVAPDQRIVFGSRSGLLGASRDGEGISLDFPAITATEVPAEPNLERALGVKAVTTCRNRFDFLIEVESEQVVRELEPDFRQLAQLGVRGVIVTARASTSDFDFVSRFFAPGAGIDEDPVTGSAHCALAPFWGPRLGKTSMIGLQVSKRGGVVGVCLDGDRVHLVGQAITVMRGQLLA